ncbi:NAD(P)-binding protein [Aspergillus stella-maris]|uniref:NAD(P)-binding protein n=1 Tax=Aspergillus stella-maris TaxID=1810926 RepID=UPI003CCCFDAB
MTSSILITGGTTGLGYHCALTLARKFPSSTIFLASRSDKDHSAETINRALSQTNVHYLPLDLSSQSAIRTFVQKWSDSNNPPISHLLLNAGLQVPGDISYTDDGIEKTFGTNHVGHALLFHLLTPFLADTARIIITASGTHDPAQNSGLPDAVYISAEDLARPTRAEDLKREGRQRYATSKLVNIMWMYALERRFESLRSKSASGPESGNVKNWTIASFDPGLMPGTGLARDAAPLVRFLWHNVLPRIIPLLRLVYTKNIHTPEESGASLAWLASDESVKGESGGYFEGRKEIKSSKDSYDVEKQEDLWGWTVRNLAGGEEEIRKFGLKSV